MTAAEALHRAYSSVNARTPLTRPIDWAEVEQRQRELLCTAVQAHVGDSCSFCGLPAMCHEY